MSLIRWSPFFYEPFEESSMQKMTAGGSIVPPIDMYETKDAVVVETPLAGVDPNKVEISIENGMLTIKGSTERKTEVDEKNYYRKEVRSGTVFRQISLPTHVVEGKTEASFDNGILKISMPKAEANKTVKVEIKKK